ncbi:hypothetical protein JDN40_13265 [Rhodomicrobium vannielii ATCC 17100]|nr:hypothetical protein [Rhodomicrobium vannielii ATCC 17100]
MKDEKHVYDLETRWQVPGQVRRLGYPPISRTFTLRKDAEVWGRQKELEIERGDLPVDARVKLKGLTLGALMERYRDSVSNTEEGQGHGTICLNAFTRHSIASKMVVDVTTADFASYRDERLKEIKPVSLKRQLDILHNVFQVAKDEWRIPLISWP